MHMRIDLHLVYSIFSLTRSMRKMTTNHGKRAEQSFYCTHTFDETNSDSQREGRSPSVNDIYANITI